MLTLRKYQSHRVHPGVSISCGNSDLGVREPLVVTLVYPPTGSGCKGKPEGKFFQIQKLKVVESGFKY